MKKFLGFSIYETKGMDSSGITLEKLMAAKRILEKNEVQARPVFFGTVPQFMKAYGYTRDETIAAIRNGCFAIYRPRRLRET